MILFWCFWTKAGGGPRLDRSIQSGAVMKPRRLRSQQTDSAENIGLDRTNIPHRADLLYSRRENVDLRLFCTESQPIISRVEVVSLSSCLFFTTVSKKHEWPTTSHQSGNNAAIKKKKKLSGCS